MLGFEGHARGATDVAAEAAVDAARPLREPAALLRTTASVAFACDLATDALSVSADGLAALGPAMPSLPATGADLISRVPPPDAARRAAAIDAACGEAAAVGAGASAVYRVAYVIRHEGGELAVEECGRAFLDVEGRPARVEGLLRRVPAADRPAPDGPAEAMESERLAALMAAVDDRLHDGERREFALLAVSIGDAGEEAPARLERRLAGLLRHADRHARHGRSLLVFLSRCGKDDLAPAGERLLRALAVPNEDGATAACRAGGALAPCGVRSAVELLRRAETALAEAAARPAGTLVAWSERLEAGRRRHAEARIVDRVVGALNDRRVRLARQPIVDAASRAPALHEGLLRLVGRDGRVTAASAIVPDAERLGLAPLLDARMLELAFAALAAEPNLKLSLNVSASTLLDDTWQAALAAGLLARRDAAHRLAIEIAASVGGGRDLVRAARAVRECGVGLALDDFGVGDASFAQALALGVETVKIDGVFVQALERSADSRHLVRSLLAEARRLGLRTVAEWVETEAAAACLADWGCDFLQGALFGPAFLEDDAGRAGWDAARGDSALSA